MPPSFTIKTYKVTFDISKISVKYEVWAASYESVWSF